MHADAPDPARHPRAAGALRERDKAVDLVICHTRSVKFLSSLLSDHATMRSAFDGRENTMKPTTIAARLLERLRPESAPATPDFADYGTAFALDLSIEAAPASGSATASGEPAAWWLQLASQRPGPGL